MLSKILGIDEAGRGSVIGSMFIAGYMIDPQLEFQLVDMGVKDSKLFTSDSQKRNRANIAKKLPSIGQSILYEILPDEIDRSLEKKTDNLNFLELRYFALIIADAAKNTDLQTVFIDAISRPEYTKKGIIKALRNIPDYKNIHILHKNNEIEGIEVNGRKILLVAENKADSKFPVVAAASIIAKNAREESLRHLERKYGLNEFSLGAGYPNENDISLMDFLRSISKEPPQKQFHFFRYTWKWKNPVWMDIVSRYRLTGKKQDSISNFFKE